MLRKRKRTKAFTTQPPLSQEDRVSQLEKLADRLERMRLGDYLDTLNRPGHVIWMNLIGGIAKGVGLTIGATLVIAVIFKLLSAVIAMNIPYLTEMLQDVVQIVRTTPGLEKIHNLSNPNVLPQSAETKNGTVFFEVQNENTKSN